MKIPVHHNPGSCPGSPAADLQDDQLIASNQKDDLADLPTPREGYQWVKVEVKYELDVKDGDWMLEQESLWHPHRDDHAPFARGVTVGLAIAHGFVARQVPTPEPEPEVIWGPKLNEVLHFRILADGTLQRQERDKWLNCLGATAGVSIAQDYASLYAKDKANTALLDSFYELGERAEAWNTWRTDDSRDNASIPESHLTILADLAKAYKEAKGDAKQDV